MIPLPSEKEMIWCNLFSKLPSESDKAKQTTAEKKHGGGFGNSSAFGVQPEADWVMPAADTVAGLEKHYGVVVSLCNPIWSYVDPHADFMTISRPVAACRESPPQRFPRKV